MDVGIYIPSRSRPTKVLTLRSIPKKLMKNTFIACTKGQLAEYRAGNPKAQVVEADASAVDMGTKREFILKHARRQGFSHVVMLDDDLRFFRRRTDDITKFSPCSEEDMISMFERINQAFREGFVHVGVTAKQGSNRQPVGGVQAARMMRLLAYDLDVLKKEKIRYDRLKCMTDFDVTLQLLRKGYANFVITDYAQDQAGSNTAGGCSTYRTKEMLAESAHQLAALHHPFVKVVEKETKGSWGGGVRTDVTVYWKKAFAAAGGGR